MRIFLAGATGVIGVRIVPQLINKGHQVSAVARTNAKRARLAELGATPVAVDLFDDAALRDALAQHDAVINMATSIPPSSRALLPGAWRANDRIRTVAAANIADATIAVGAKRLIQESFAPIYPDCGDEWIDERTPVKPARYNRSTLDAERAAERFTRSGGSGVVLRFALFYGHDSGFTLDALRYVRKGWAAALGSPAGFISSITHDDAASAVLAALDVPGGVYNVVDDEPVRRREYFDLLAAGLGVDPPKFPPPWLSRITGSIGETLARSQRISNAKLKSMSDWQPEAPSVREGWPRVLAQVSGRIQPAPVGAR
jgi:nucleoside-diphosphate-sugar epimerase